MSFGVFAVSGEIVNVAGSASKTGVFETITFDVIIDTLLIPPIKVYVAFENALCKIVFAFVTPNGETFPGKL